MLVLTRKEGQRIVIGDSIEVVVKRISGGRVRLAIEAPREVRVVRDDAKPTRNENDRKAG